MGTCSDDEGSFLVPEDWPDNGEFLSIDLPDVHDSDYDCFFRFERAGPLCRLWGSMMWESGDDPPFIYEPDDLAAVQRLSSDLRRFSMRRVARVSGSLVRTMDPPGQFDLVNELKPYLDWLPAWWLDGTLWLDRAAAQDQVLASCEMQDGLIRLDEHSFLIGDAIEEPASPPDGRLVLMLPEEDDRLDLLFSAAFALGDTFDDQLAAQFEHPLAGCWVGVEVSDEGDHLQIARSFGTLALVIDPTSVSQVRPEGWRRWGLDETSREAKQPRIELPDWGY